MRLFVLLFLLISTSLFAQHPEIKLYLSAENFINDSSEVIDTTMRFQVHKKSEDPNDPTYALSYLSKKGKGKRRFYNENLFAIKVGKTFYARERTDVFGAARYRPITYCSYVSYYSLLSRDTFSNSKDPNELKRTYYMIFMDDDAMIKPLTEPRVRESLIRTNKLLYNEFSMASPHTIEDLLRYLDRICE